MKINSISSFNYNVNRPSFKHTAVPYPEYESAYSYNNDSEFVSRKVDSVVSKLAALFSPKVSKEAKAIKSDIDSIYKDNKVVVKDPRKKSLSYVA